jgi:predicted PurR-regulated permease PerM
MKRAFLASATLLWLAVPAIAKPLGQQGISIPPAAEPTINYQVLTQLGEQKGELSGMNEKLTDLNSSVKQIQANIDEMRREVDRIEWVSSLFKFSLQTALTVVITVILTFFLGGVLKKKWPTFSRPAT